MTEHVQPDGRFVIQTLQEELKAANDNRLYLLSIIKQMAAEFKDAQEMWKLERESLKQSEGG